MKVEVVFNMRFFRIKMGKLRYMFTNRLFEEFKTIVLNLFRYLAKYYEAEYEGTTIFTLGIITGIDVDILDTVVSDLIMEEKIYESNVHEYRIY